MEVDSPPPDGSSSAENKRTRNERDTLRLDPVSPSRANGGASANDDALSAQPMVISGTPPRGESTGLELAPKRALAFPLPPDGSFHAHLRERFEGLGSAADFADRLGLGAGTTIPFFATSAVECEKFITVRLCQRPYDAYGRRFTC